MPTLDLSHLDGRDEDRIDVDRGYSESFDRIAFALEAVEIARPAHMTVAVCATTSTLRVEWGRTWGRGPDEAWAVVHVPHAASREAIALAVSRLRLGRIRADGAAPMAPSAY